jgi:hypothetical protein
MILALSWLTVSLPCIIRSQKTTPSSNSSNKTEDNNPLPNNSEENTPQVGSEEYLYHEESNVSEEQKPAIGWHLQPATELPRQPIDYFSPPPNKG